MLPPTWNEINFLKTMWKEKVANSLSYVVNHLISIWLWRMPSSGMWRHVDPVKWTDVSEERIASILKVEKFASEEPAWAGSSRIFLLGTAATYPCWFLVRGFFYSETSVQFTGSTRRHITEDCILHSYRCENLKSYEVIVTYRLVETRFAKL
jgi:hypothetical protein